MANGDPAAYTVKEFLTLMDERINVRLDRIDLKLEEKASASAVLGIERRVAAAELEMERRSQFIRELGELRTHIDELQQAVLTPEGVKKIIGDTLQDAEARGWSSRERTMGLVLFIVTVLSFALNIFAAI